MLQPIQRPLPTDQYTIPLSHQPAIPEQTNPLSESADVDAMRDALRAKDGVLSAMAEAVQRMKHKTQVQQQTTS